MKRGDVTIVSTIDCGPLTGVVLSSDGKQVMLLNTNVMVGTVYYVARCSDLERVAEVYSDEQIDGLLAAHSLMHEKVLPDSTSKVLFVGARPVEHIGSARPKDPWWKP